MSRLERPAAMSRVLFWRRQRGLTQQQLAEATGLSEKTIERFDQKRADNPRIRSLLRIAAVLDVPLLELVEDDWNAESRPSAEAR
jgi:transcriptional regulator with XRE-family HTH domain